MVEWRAETHTVEPNAFGGSEYNRENGHGRCDQGSKSAKSTNSGQVMLGGDAVAQKYQCMVLQPPMCEGLRQYCRCIVCRAPPHVTGACTAVTFAQVAMLRPFGI
eukprot:CAMPEP_0119321170 /NCGR_PEP_ID=MMETSP1333-20130426/54635_1 /TAXON_ID=418940 /ORGANISM="Scyphosphaera apsteinii, Strain RCC1455" /LENGTH=104 /DNA_ID=CAMNT_0007328087 /DNA_START=604 /DNA_END=918 /DNA_ORIENTATION=+